MSASFNHVDHDTLLTYGTAAARFLTGDTHPDHDSNCRFPRESQELLSLAFHQVLGPAGRARILHVDDMTSAIDGTKILANASKHSAGERVAVEFLAVKYHVRARGRPNRAPKVVARAAAMVNLSAGRK